MTPKVSLNLGRGEGAGGAVPRPSAWSRTLRSATGEPIDPETFDRSQLVRVAWQQPLALRAWRDRVWVGVERGCSRAVSVSAWSVVLDGEVDRASTLLRVTEGSSRLRASAGGGRTIGAVEIAPLLNDIPLTLEEEVRWLLFLEGRGKHEFVQEWQNLPLQEALTVRPCEVRWFPVPIKRVIALFESAERAPLSPTAKLEQEMSVGINPMLSDEQIAQTARALGLVGRAEYDLQQLHQAALSVQMGGRLPRGADASAARWLRLSRVKALSTSPEGVRTLCELGEHRHLFALPLTLWGGDTTVPSALRPSCPVNVVR